MIDDGEQFRDELNDTVIEIVDVEGSVATVRDDDGTEWRERVRDLQVKIDAGDWTPVDEAESATEQEGFADYDSWDDCVQANSDKEDPEAYCAAIKREVEGEADIGEKAVGDDDWSGQLRLFRIVPGEGQASDYDDDVLGVGVSFPEAGVYVDWHRAAFPDELDEPHVSEYGSVSDLEKATQNDVVDMMPPRGATNVTQDAVSQKAEFDEGEAVQWDWQDEPVHGRVAEVREQATVSGNTISGDDGERDVYVIDEWDDRVEAFRRENVAKPESSLDESGKDLPPRDDSNYVDSEAWESLTTTVAASDFTAPELDGITQEFDGVLEAARPNEWLVPDPQEPVVYRYEIPEQYLDDRSEEFFVPNAGVADAARKVEGWVDEHGDDIAGGAPDGEGARRREQLIEHHERGEPLAIEYWQEIAAYHDRHHSQDNHELDEEYTDEPWRDAGYVSHLNWGGDAGYSQAQDVMDTVEDVEQEAALTMHGAVATEESLPPSALTKQESNEVDLDALEGELREAVTADDFYVYGKASIEQWDDDEPPTLIQMDALEGALDRYLESEAAPGIISRHHQDIPVGRPVREFEFSEDTTLEIDDETYQFEAGDVARTHVEDADDDGRPELWLAANIDGTTEIGKKTRVLAAQGDLNGFSVTVHRNRDEMTQEGRVVTNCDLHAVTIGTGEQIKNPGSEFDVAGFKGRIAQARDRVLDFVS